MKVIERIVKNWLPLLAIVLSLASFFRCESFVFTESSLHWVLGIIVAIVGIAVSVALVTQIWTAIQIDKIIDKRIEDLMKTLNRAFGDQEKVAYDLSVCTSMYVEGQLKAIIGQHSDSLYSFIFAIKAAKRAKREDLCDIYAAQTLRFFKEQKKSSTRLTIPKEEVRMYVEDMSDISSEKVKELSEYIISLSAR